MTAGKNNPNYDEWKIKHPSLWLKGAKELFYKIVSKINNKGKLK